MIGVDIAESMLEEAGKKDPGGDYRRIPVGSLGSIEGERFDLVLSAFTFDNVAGYDTRLALFDSLGRLLADDGRIVNLVSAPEIYLNEWASFSTQEFPENRMAKSGEAVRIVMLDVEDSRPVEDVLSTDADYRELYASTGLEVLALHAPLGRPEDPCAWVSETELSPWAIYVLARRP